jgi:hypothetical protein
MPLQHHSYCKLLAVAAGDHHITTMPFQLLPQHHVTLLLCYLTLHRQEVPYTHRRHAIMMVSQKMELHIGQQTFHEVCSM